jgi:hypothetical protein
MAHFEGLEQLGKVIKEDQSYLSHFSRLKAEVPILLA